jgi:hypothetical protein
MAPHGGSTVSNEDSPDFIGDQLVLHHFGGMLEYIKAKQKVAPTLTVDELIREVEADLADAQAAMARHMF